MPFTFISRWALALCIALSALSSSDIFAQSEDAKPPEAQKPATAGAVKEGEKEKKDEIAEAARLLTGPAGQPECIWLGHRIVTLLWRDDLDTAFRHLDLYDRFGCPGAHIQAAFRCVVRQRNIDPKVQATLVNRVQECWIDPGLPPTPAPATANTSTGTTPR